MTVNKSTIRSMGGSYSFNSRPAFEALGIDGEDGVKWMVLGDTLVIVPSDYSDSEVERRAVAAQGASTEDNDYSA